jgi:hypothetical protein
MDVDSIMREAVTIKQEIDSHIRSYPSKKEQIKAILFYWKGWKADVAIRILAEGSIDELFAKKILKNRQ